MTVQNIIDLAASAELKQLAVKTDTTAVIGFINLAVIELYKRFNLKTSIEVITTSVTTPYYTLRSEDINIIIAVYTEAGKELKLQEVIQYEGENAYAYDYRVMGYNSILLIDPKDDNLYVEYRASPKLVTSVTDTIEIPLGMLEALTAYIQYKAFSSSSNDNNAELVYYRKFEQSCKNLESLGYNAANDIVSLPITSKGFL